MGRGQGKDSGLVSLYSVRFSPSAARELEEAILWYADKRSAAGASFRAAVIEAIELLAHKPLSWRQVTETGVRRFQVTTYPYTVYYEVVGNVVYVLSVAHHRRAPKFPPD